MSPKEFVDRVMALAALRGVDVGSFVPWDVAEFHDLEIYEQLGGESLREHVVYVMCAGRQHAPDIVRPETFADAITRVESLPMDLERVDVPNTGQWPGTHYLVWMAIMGAGWPVKSDRPMPWTKMPEQVVPDARRIHVDTLSLGPGGEEPFGRDGSAIDKILEAYRLPRSMLELDSEPMNRAAAEIHLEYHRNRRQALLDIASDRSSHREETATSEADAVFGELGAVEQ